MYDRDHPGQAQSARDAPECTHIPQMTAAEPTATALLLVAFGSLLLIAVLFSRATERLSVPVALLFLLVGVLAGSEGIGRIPFEDYAFAYRLGSIALVLILFDGGLNTPIAAVRRVAAPASVLATLGVMITAGGVTLIAHYLLGRTWAEAALLGAVVSSTDAAAVFAVLRGSGLHLRRRVGATLEVESGANDPMAVILTMTLTANILEPGGLGVGGLLFGVVTQLVIGLAAGAAIGYGGRWLIAHARLPAGGLYAAVMLGLAFLAFGAPSLVGGSGFLSVYVAGLILGNGPLPFRAGLLRVNDALAWLSQITMFLILGLLVQPSRLPEVALAGVALALAAVFVARPIAVVLCLAPFRYPRREVGYIAWVGLRGAVPIILATYPILQGVPEAVRLFDVVFFIVIVSAILPGSTVPWITRRLGMGRREPPPPPAVLEIESRFPLRGELMSFYIDDDLPVAGATLRDIPVPAGATVALLVRGRDLVPPSGATVLQPGDHVYVITEPQNRAEIQLLFGTPENE